MTAEQQRTRLLYKILIEGEQPVELKFALKELFSDITITSWAFKHSLSYHIESFQRLAGRSDKWEFIVFYKLNDDEL